MAIWQGEFSLLDRASGQITLRMCVNQSSMSAALSSFAALIPFIQQVTCCAVQSAYVLNPISYTYYPPTAGEWGTVGSIMLAQVATSIEGVFAYFRIPSPINNLVNGDVNNTLNTSSSQWTGLLSAMQEQQVTDQMGNAITTNVPPTGVLLSNSYSVLINKSVSSTYSSNVAQGMRMNQARIG